MMLHRGIGGVLALFSACGGLTTVDDGGTDAMTAADGSPASDVSTFDADASPGCEPVIDWWMRSGSSSAQQCNGCLSTAEGNPPCVSAEPPYAECKWFNDCVNVDCVHVDSGVCDCMQTCADMSDGGGCKAALDGYLLCLYQACAASCP